jgi:nicotinamide-nucleotide amidase
MYRIQVIESIKNVLTANGQSLSVAESVTSGHLQAALSLASEASKFFHGGITAYNLGQKARHLHVNPIHATSCNSVSQTVAEEMAMNANRLFLSDWAIGVTGYATPLPEMGIHELFAFYAIALHEKIVLKGRIEGQDGDALSLQIHYANSILSDFQRYLSQMKSRTSIASV